MKQHGLRRGDASAQTIEAWAKEIDRSAHFVKPNMADGEAIIFDGRLWHGTENERQDKRTALLLQYAAVTKKLVFQTGPSSNGPSGSGQSDHRP